MASILIVDDTETERTRICGLLSANGEHTVHHVATGQLALDSIEPFSVDLVVTDLRMPEMSGIELIQELQNQHPRVPVVLMASLGSEEETVQAIQKGASGYLNKATAAKDLTSLVTRLLSARATKLAHATLLRRREIDEYRFRLPSCRSIMSATAGFLRAKIQAAEICPENNLLRLGISIEEALLNACLHGNLELDSCLRDEEGNKFEALADHRSKLAPWNTRHVHVDALITPEQARIVVRDEGKGFDPEMLPDPTDPENLLKAHGRGVMMMKMFLDEVTWNPTGNEVTLLMNADRNTD